MKGEFGGALKPPRMSALGSLRRARGGRLPKGLDRLAFCCGPASARICLSASTIMHIAAETLMLVSTFRIRLRGLELLTRVIALYYTSLCCEGLIMNDTSY